MKPQARCTRLLPSRVGAVRERRSYKQQAKTGSSHIGGPIIRSPAAADRAQQDLAAALAEIAALLPRGERKLASPTAPQSLPRQIMRLNNRGHRTGCDGSSDPRRAYTVNETARLLSVSRSTVNKLIKFNKSLKTIRGVRSPPDHTRVHRRSAWRCPVTGISLFVQDGTCTDCTAVPEGPEAQEKTRAELRERIDALNGMDENGARAIVADAVKAGLSALAVETLIGPLAKKLGVKQTYARKFWKEVEEV